jgi:hypothetical protein
VTRNHANDSFPRKKLPAENLPKARPNLIANHPALIANETHSREDSSACKQSTYHFLIANEFHCANPALQTCEHSKLLDFALTRPKSGTSQFLIDNFGACLTRRPPWRVGALTAPKQSTAEVGHSPLVYPETRRATNCHVSTRCSDPSRTERWAEHHRD